LPQESDAIAGRSVERVSVVFLREAFHEPREEPKNLLELVSRPILGDDGAVGNSILGMAGDELITMAARLGCQGVQLFVAQCGVHL
jgi:hypothetical protein